jgi:hypothetical protein
MPSEEFLPPLKIPANCQLIQSYGKAALILSMSLFTAGCAGPGAASSGGNTILIDNPEVGLDIYIGRLSGVRVSGSGAGATMRSGHEGRNGMIEITMSG